MRTSWPGTSAVFGKDAVAGLDHAVHVPFGRAGFGKDFCERILGPDLDDDDFAAFEIVGGLVGGFGGFDNIGGVEIVAWSPTSVARIDVPSTGTAGPRSLRRHRAAHQNRRPVHGAVASALRSTMSWTSCVSSSCPSSSGRMPPSSSTTLTDTSDRDSPLPALSSASSSVSVAWPLP